MIQCALARMLIACENIRFSSLFAAGDGSRGERLRLSDRNSILVTYNLSGIRSEALVG